MRLPSLTLTPLPAGEREGKGLYPAVSKALTSHRFAAGPSSPLQGEGKAEADAVSSFISNNVKEPVPVRNSATRTK